MSGSSKEERGKSVFKGSSPAAGPVGLNVLKRDGTVQPFDRNKLVNSIQNAGVTPPQASSVSDRVISGLGGQQTVASSTISGMVARSLSKVNPVASNQYVTFSNQKIGGHSAAPTVSAAPVVATVARAQMPLSQQTPRIPAPRLLTVSASPANISVFAGQPATFSATALGGTPPYTYQWVEVSTDEETVTSDSTWVQSFSIGVPTYVKEVGNSATLEIYKDAGRYRFHCRVTDSAGSPTRALSDYVWLHVVRVEQLFVTPEPPMAQVRVGQSATFWAKVEGGVPPYTFEWFEGSAQVGTWADLTISKSEAGTYWFRCSVKDSLGNLAIARYSDTVTLYVL